MTFVRIALVVCAIVLATLALMGTGALLGCIAMQDCVTGQTP